MAANDKVRQWTKDVDHTKHPTYIWARDELERLGIRLLNPLVKEKKEKRQREENNRLRPCMVSVSET